MESIFPPVGELMPVEIEILDATLPALALGDDTPLLQALEAILHARVSQHQWDAFEHLSQDGKLAVLDQVRAQIPLIAQG
jgi:hypothetical protein